MTGVDLRTVAELLGHRKLQIAMRYSRLAPEYQGSAFDRLEKTGNRRGTKSDTEASDAKDRKRMNLLNSSKTRS